MRRALMLTIAVAALSCATKPTSKPAPEPPAPVPSATTTAPAPSPEPAGREVPASALIDHLGDSKETSVPVPITVENEGVDYQNRWIFDHFGRFRRKKFAMGHAPGASGKERHYDIITFEVPDGSLHTVYFDMTEYWESVARKEKQ